MHRSTPILIVTLLLLFSPLDAEEPPRAAELPRTAWIGVVVSDAGRDGVQVVLTVDQGPAQLAGLRSGDVILRLDDRPVRDADGFRALLQARQAGEQLPVLIRREGAERRLEILSRGRPASRTVSVAAVPAPPTPRAVVPRPAQAPLAGLAGSPGLTLQPLTPELRGHFGAPERIGVLVTRVENGRLGDRLGIEVGDVLTRIGDDPVSDPARALARLIVPSSERRVEIVRGGRVVTLEAKSPTPPSASPEWPGRLAAADRARQRALLRNEIDRLESRLKVLRERLQRLEPE